MKQSLSLLLMLCMLLSVIAPTAVIAEPSAETEVFWLTHYNDGKVEGSGVIFTSEDTAGGWWLHVAFAPIDGVKNAYEIVEISNGVADGLASPVAVPEGGFVWASNYGNDYPSLGMGDTDYTNYNCTAAITRAFAWAVGDQFVIEGVDFETIPTSTPETLWYDDAYVCTSTITPYGETSHANYRTEIDVNEIPCLTDGIEGMYGSWNDYIKENVCLIQNPYCQKSAMEAVLTYDLGELAKIDTLTLAFYHDAWVMIGYPEGTILVEVSKDGKVFESVGLFELAPAYVSMYSNGTEATTCSFEPTEARFVRATVVAGSNRDALGDAPTDGKFFWEFLAVVEFAVGEAVEPVPPVYEDGNVAQGKEYSAVGLYPNSFSPTYPDEGGVTLTDGVVSPETVDFADPVWVGFNAQSEEYSMFEGASVVIDLGEVKALNKGVVHAYKQTDVGITVPYGVEFCVSDNGRVFQTVGVVAIDPAEIEEGIYDIVCDFYTEASGRYVKINLFLYGWGFVSEIGLYYEGGEKPENTTNLALGKDVLHAGVNGENNSYNADLTDGIASDVISYDGEWFAYYYNLEYSNEVNTMIGANSEYGLATPAIDLGTVCKLDSMRINMFLGNDSGVMAPYVVYAEASSDGLTYSQVGAVEFASAPMGDTTVGWVDFDVRAGIEARYVRFHMAHRLNWIFINEIEVYGCAEDGDVDPDPGVPVDPVPEEYIQKFESMVGVTENAKYDLVLDAAADANGNVTVTLTAENIDKGVDLTGVFADLFYDSDRLALTTLAEEDSGALACITKLPDDRWENMVWLAEEGHIVVELCVDGVNAPITPDAPLVLTFTFALKDGCNYGALYIPSDTVTGIDWNFVDFCGNGSYAIAEKLVPSILYGDANGDGKISSADVTRLMQYLANYDYENGTSAVEVTAGADCNGDGMIDGRDSVRLLRYLADRDPMTGESSVVLGPRA